MKKKDKEKIKDLIAKHGPIGILEIVSDYLMDTANYNFKTKEFNRANNYSDTMNELEKLIEYSEERYIV